MNTFYRNCDTSLNLRMDYDKGICLPKEKALAELEKSQIIAELTGEFIDRPLFYIWRLSALSEIPYTQYLDYTQNLIERVYAVMATPFGFSLSGDEKMFLPCYSAMLVSALSRLGRVTDNEVIRAANWINRNQPMERGKELSVTGFNFNKYGGCFKTVPCYINIAKATKALIDFEVESGNNNFAAKKEQGIEYILQHHLYKRLSSGKPITNHILDIAFPYSYHLNIVELLEIIGKAGRMADSRTMDAINYLESRKQNNGWKISYRYKSGGYMVFDKPRQSAQWLTYIIESLLKYKDK